ncbi:MAG: hypothetical protein ACOYL6_18885 [Bacteriovoracaceae bacterium]
MNKIIVILFPFILISCASKSEDDKVLNDLNITFSEYARSRRTDECYRQIPNEKQPVKDLEIVYLVSTGGLGGVIGAKLLSSQVQNAELEQCILEVLLKEKFPESPSTDIRYRLVTP